MTSLIERTVSYQADLSEAYAKGKNRAVSIAEEKLKTSWQLIQGEYIQYKQENEKAKPLIDELQTVRNWKLHGYERRSAI